MKLITKEGMIFEKVNIIDVVIVLAVIAVVFLGAMKIRDDKGPAFVADKTEFEVDILLRSMYDGFQAEINVGDKLYDAKSGAYLGEIIKKDVAPAVREVEAADGSVVLSDVPNRWDIRFTIDGQGIYNANSGLNIGGEVRYVGLFFRMRTPTFLVDGVIVDIRVPGE